MNRIPPIVGKNGYPDKDAKKLLDYIRDAECEALDKYVRGVYSPSMSVLTYANRFYNALMQLSEEERWRFYVLLQCQAFPIPSDLFDEK